MSSFQQSQDIKGRGKPWHLLKMAARAVQQRVPPPPSPIAESNPLTIKNCYVVVGDRGLIPRLTAPYTKASMLTPKEVLVRQLTPVSYSKSMFSPGRG